jgi:hypothetical protein
MDAFFSVWPRVAETAMLSSIERYRTGRVSYLRLADAVIRPEHWMAIMEAVSDAPKTNRNAEVGFVHCTLVDLPRSCFVDLLSCIQKQQRRLSLDLEWVRADHTKANDADGGPATIFAQLKCLFDHLRDHDNTSLFALRVHTADLQLETLLRIAHPVFAHRIRCTEVWLSAIHCTDAAHVAFRSILCALMRHPTLDKLYVYGSRCELGDHVNKTVDTAAMVKMAQASDFLRTRIYFEKKDTLAGSTVEPLGSPVHPLENKIPYTGPVHRLWGLARIWQDIHPTHWDHYQIPCVDAVEVGDPERDMEQTCRTIVLRYASARAIVIGTERASVHDTWCSRHASASVHGTAWSRNAGAS